MDAWRSPGWILSSHAEDQGANLCAHRLPSARLVHPGDEPPIQAKPRAMPPNHCSGCNQNQRLFPASPKPSQHDPEQLVQSTESPARSPCAQSQELLAEGKVFEDEILSRTEGTDNPADEVSEPPDHGQDRIETIPPQTVGNSFILRVHQVLMRDNGKLLDLEMLVLTPRGRERTKAEFIRLLRGAGFRLSRVIATESPLSIVEAVKA